MPHIAEALRQSKRGRRTVAGIVLNSLLGRRSITDSVSNVKTTFSSWDNCMAQSYCKWPVIAGIVVGSLIIFSILWCCIRCCCCGMSCCCTCFSFLKCCDCCGGLCDGKKDKKMKHLDDPYGHHGPPTGGYFPPSPMMAGGLGSKPPPAQFAQFEVGRNGLAVDPKPVNEDALPPMPSWEGAQKKHVLTEEEKNAVELGELDPATGQKVPLMSGAAGVANTAPPSPANEVGVSPFGARPGQMGGNGYIGAAPGDPYTQNNKSFGTNELNRGDYQGPQGPQGRGYGTPQDDYGYDNYNTPAEAYNRPMQRQNTGANGQYPPQLTRHATGNSSAYDSQYSDYSPSNNFNQPQGPPRGPSNSNFNAPPPRGPSRGPNPNGRFHELPRGPSRGANRMPSPPMNNDAGFDYNSGQQSYPRSRPTPPPQQPSYDYSRRPSLPNGRNDGYGNDGYYEGSTAPPSYATRSPPPQEPSYPGYQAYQSPEPTSNHHRAPTALRPGAGRDRREPQNWDPVNH